MKEFFASKRNQRYMVIAAFALLVGAAVAVPTIQRHREHRRLDAFVTTRIYSQSDKSPVTVADDATLLQGGQPIDCSWMTSKVVKPGEMVVNLPWTGSLIFVCPAGEGTVEFRDRLGLPCRWLTVTGPGRGIAFADGTLYLEGTARASAKNFGSIVCESGIHVDARDSGTVLARAGATFREFSTLAEYSAYSKQVQDIEKLVLNSESDTKGIDVRDGTIIFNGQPLDERWLRVVRAEVSDREKEVYLGEPTVFTTQTGGELTLRIEGSQKPSLKIAGRSKGVIFRDGTIWLLEGTCVSGENLERVVLNPGLNMKLANSVKAPKEDGKTKKKTSTEEEPIRTATTRIISRSTR